MCAGVSGLVPVVNRPDADALNDRLGYIVQRVREEITNLQKAGKEIDVQAIKDKLWEKEKKSEKGGSVEMDRRADSDARTW